MTSPRVTRILRMAMAETPSAKEMIGGAVNDCYERLCETALEKTAEKAKALGMSEAEHDIETAKYIALKAVEAALQFHR